MTGVNGFPSNLGDTFGCFCGFLTMKKRIAAASLLLALALPASADIWKWVDANGVTRFVDSNRPIYTWVIDGKVYFADKPGHEDATSVDLVWHSPENLEDFQAARESDDGFAFEGETEAERNEREQAEAYYCNRATEIYESYLAAPRLYKTNEGGQKVYLSEAEAEQTIAETKAKVDEFFG